MSNRSNQASELTPDGIYHQTLLLWYYLLKNNTEVKNNRKEKRDIKWCLLEITLSLICYTIVCFLLDCNFLWKWLGLNFLHVGSPSSNWDHHRGCFWIFPQGCTLSSFTNRHLEESGEVVFFWLQWSCGRSHCRFRCLCSCGHPFREWSYSKRTENGLSFPKYRCSDMSRCHYRAWVRVSACILCN